MLYNKQPSLPVTGHHMHAYMIHIFLLQILAQYMSLQKVHGNFNLQMWLSQLQV